MMRLFFLSACLILCTATNQRAYAQDTVATPRGYTRMAQERGDLDKDGQEELVLLFDTPKETDLGTERILQVYKRQAKGWQLWKESKNAVLPSLHGGMMGDPFDGIAIERGCIVIDHTGGSRQKWHYTHRFRFQNGDFYLIGATIHFGAPCDYFIDYDYNLSTGQIEGTITTEECADNSDEVKTKVRKVKLTKKPSKAMHLQDFVPGDHEMKIPGQDSFYY